MARLKRVFQCYEDCGHAWLKVPKKMLNELGVIDKITSCSYQRGEYAYLEEDCDISTFYHAYKDKYGVEPKCRHHYSDRSKIRSYEHYDGAIIATLFQV